MSRPGKKILMFGASEPVASMLRLVLDTHGYRIVETDSLDEVWRRVEFDRGKDSCDRESIHAVLLFGRTSQVRDELKAHCREIDPFRSCIVISERGLVWKKRHSTITEGKMADLIAQLKRGVAMGAYGHKYGFGSKNPYARRRLSRDGERARRDRAKVAA